MAGRSGRSGASGVGMMEGAFFVSRTELLAWANGLLQLSLTKVEQCASGAVYCQIIDACHPGTIAMRKVNWMAKAEHEFVPNFKVLQAAFDKNGIQRHIDVDKLIRGKYQDNLEFLQFIKCYADREGAGQCDYDPFPAREGKQIPVWAQAGASGAEQPIRGGGGASASASSALGGVRAGKENLKPDEASAGKRPSSGRVSPKAAAAAPPRAAAAAPAPGRRPAAGAPGASSAEVEALRARTVNQDEELDDLRNTIEGLEHERDYYFRKLREVEIMCNNLQTRMGDSEALPDCTHKKLVTEIQDILYAENEDEEGAAADGAQEGDGDAPGVPAA